MIIQFSVVIKNLFKLTFALKNIYNIFVLTKNINQIYYIMRSVSIKKLLLTISLLLIVIATLVAVCIPGDIFVRKISVCVMLFLGLLLQVVTFILLFRKQYAGSCLTKIVLILSICSCLLIPLLLFLEHSDIYLNIPIENKIINFNKKSFSTSVLVVKLRSLFKSLTFVGIIPSILLNSLLIIIFVIFLSMKLF